MCSHITNQNNDEIERELNEEIEAAIRANDEDEILRYMDAIIAALVINRKKKKLSQSDIAQKCNVHRNSICRVESFAETPSLRTVIKYADSVGMRLVLTEK